MATERDIAKAKAKVDTAKENKRVDELRKKQLLEELKEEFGVDNLKEAVKLLKKKREELEDLSKEKDKKYDKFIEQYGDELEID